MIIKNYLLNKSNIDKYNLFLLYGKNDGFQNEVIQKFFINDFKGQVNKYDENEFLVNNETIVNEILNKSLFEKEKIIIISRVSDKILKLIQEILEKKLIDIKLILKSKTLEKRSKLRLFFEKDKRVAITPFYEDDQKNLTPIINEFLNKNKIKLSKESVNLIISRARGDRENLKTELDKIFSYSFSKKTIEFDTVKILTNLAENHDVNELADNYLTKNKRNINKILNENNYSNDDCILIIRTISSKSKRLATLIKTYKKYKNIDEVISNAKPPIFWKEKETVKNQIVSWDLDDLKRKIYELNDIEYLVKSNNNNSLNLISDFIVNN
tara:strand:- start:93 stop:1070 length:978 start_codon:yes stop_codon:yes gene_type:complete